MVADILRIGTTGHRPQTTNDQNTKPHFVLFSQIFGYVLLSVRLDSVSIESKSSFLLRVLTAVLFDDAKHTEGVFLDQDTFVRVRGLLRERILRIPNSP